MCIRDRFLFRTDTNKLLRASDIDADGRFEDFVAWDAKRAGVLAWCSDENRYCTDEGVEVDAQLSGPYRVKLADGGEAECITCLLYTSRCVYETGRRRCASPRWWW